MHSTDWLQFALFLGLLTLITKPLGLYLMQVLDANGRTWLDPIVKPFEKITYKLLGVDPQREQGWKQYTFALLAFSLAGVVFTYAVLRLQHVLPWNPQELPALSHHLAFGGRIAKGRATTCGSMPTTCGRSSKAPGSKSGMTRESDTGWCPAVRRARFELRSGPPFGILH